jgi:hypothetical protein
MNSSTIRRIARTPRPLLTPLMLAALGIASVARAQDGASQAPSAKELMERIERLEASNRALAGEVQTLRTADGDAWLTEERASEIRSIVSDVLADSATRDSLQTSTSTSGWNDGFYLQSADGRFRLEVGGLIQMRYIYGYIPDGVSGLNTGPGGLPQPTQWIADNVETRSGFDLPGTQLDLKGHIFGPTWQYKIKGAFSNQDEAVIGQNPFATLATAAAHSACSMLTCELMSLMISRCALVSSNCPLLANNSLIPSINSPFRARRLLSTSASDDRRASRELGLPTTLARCSRSPTVEPTISTAFSRLSAAIR